MAHSAKIDRQYSLPVPFEAQVHITGYDRTDPWANQANDVMGSIIMGVKIARGLAVSHRNFTVGAIGKGLRQRLHDGSDVYPVFHGANEKPLRDGPINIHAEPDVTDAAERSGSLLSSLVLWGDNQPDQKSGILFPAIVPCLAVCLPILKASSAIDVQRTGVASVSPDGKKVLYYKIPQLEQAYKTGNPDMLYCAEFATGIDFFDPYNNSRELTVRDTTDDGTFDALYARMYES